MKAACVFDAIARGSLVFLYPSLCVFARQSAYGDARTRPHEWRGLDPGGRNQAVSQFSSVLPATRLSDGSSTPRKELSCRNVSARRRSDLIEAAADSSTQNVPPPFRGNDCKQNGETNEADLYDCGA